MYTTCVSCIFLFDHILLTNSLKSFLNQLLQFTAETAILNRLKPTIKYSTLRSRFRPCISNTIYHSSLAPKTYRRQCSLLLISIEAELQATISMQTKCNLLELPSFKNLKSVILHFFLNSGHIECI